MKKTILVVLIFFTVFIFPRVALAGCHSDLKDSVDDGLAVASDDIYSYFPAADIVAAWMKPADNYPAMEFGVTTQGAFQYGDGQNFNVFFFLDMDNDPANNAKSGTRAGSDTAFSLLWGTENREWKTVAWSYDSSADTWDSRIDPSILFMPLDMENGFIIHVPYEIVPKDTDVPFRATVALSKDQQSMMDSLPD